MSVVKITPDQILADAAEKLRKHPSLENIIILSTQDGKVHGVDTAGGIPKEVAIEYIKLLAGQVDKKLLETIEYELHFLNG